MRSSPHTDSPERLRAPGGGRKKSFDPDVVLTQALEVFWKHGFAATTTRQLEDELGLKASSIYNAFGSKGELLDAAVGRYLEQLDRDLLGRLRLAKDPLDGLEEFIQLISVGLDGKHPWGCLVVTLLCENGGRQPELTVHTDGYLGVLRHEVTRALTSAADLGHIEHSSIPTRLEIVVMAVLGINTAARGRLGPEAVSAMADATCNQIREWRSADAPPVAH